MEHSRSITIGNLRLGDGIPKICVPVVAETIEGVLKEAQKIQTLPADLVEWRIDYLENPEEGITILPQLKKLLEPRPLLITFRSAKEGGRRAIRPEAYVTIYRKYLASGLTDLLDVELFMGDAAAEVLIQEAHKAGGKVILSSHEFSYTPTEEEMLSRLRRMQELGADVTKLAVMPKSTEDVMRLLSATAAMKEHYADRPFITMSMGELGMVSRISGALTGSAVTFGSAAAASAPGQLEVHKLRKILNALQPSAGKKHIFLIGFMGSGKSTIAGILSSLTGRACVEMDEAIVQKEQMPITEIFFRKGEPYFRKLETDLLQNLKEREPQIISCGGGVPMREENVEIMRSCGTIVLLQASPEVILERVKKSTERPILNGHMNIGYIEELMDKRREAYLSASDLSIETDGRTAEAIAQEILDKLQK